MGQKQSRENLPDTKAKTALLQHIPLFAPFESTDPFLQMVVKSLVTRVVSNGKLLVRPGDRGDECYIVVRGTFTVRNPETGKPLLSLNEKGAYLGEHALFYEKQRTVEVFADGGHATALVLMKGDFDTALSRYPAVDEKIKALFNVGVMDYEGHVETNVDGELIRAAESVKEEEQQQQQQSQQQQQEDPHQDCAEVQNGEEGERSRKGSIQQSSAANVDGQEGERGTGQGAGMLGISPGSFPNKNNSIDILSVSIASSNQRSRSSSQAVGETGEVGKE